MRILRCAQNDRDGRQTQNAAFSGGGGRVGEKGKRSLAEGEGLAVYDDGGQVGGIDGLGEGQAEAD